MGASVAIPLIISAVSTGAGIAAREQAGKAQRAEIQSSINQQRIAEGDRSLKRMHRLQGTMSEAAALEASRNVSLASPSFQALQQSSFRNFQQDQNADAVNLMFREDGLRQQINQSRLSQEVDVGRSLMGMGQFFAGGLDLERLSRGTPEDEQQLP